MSFCRVVALAAAVVDEVQGHLDLLLLETRDGKDLGRVHDGRVEARLDALVEEHGVEDDPGGRVQAEGDVRQAQRGLHIGAAALELTDRLDGGDAVLAGLLLAGADREGQRVDEDVALVHAPVAGQVVDEPLGDGDLVLDRTGLALFVDGERDERGSVLGREPGDLREPRLGPVPVLVVDGVEDRAAAQLLQPGPKDVDFGGVEHDGQRRRGGETVGQFLHVGDAVPAHVVDAEVEHVRALADLVPCHLHAVVPAAVQHGLAELLGPVGVRPLADGHERGVLTERHGLVEGRGARLGVRHALGGREIAYALDDLAQMLGRRTAAAADQGKAVFAYEGLLRVGQLTRRQG